MQKISITYLIILNLLTGVLSSNTIGQDIKPTAVSTTKGVWIYLGNEIPNAFQYQVFKKQGDGNFSLIGTTSYLEDANTMKTKVAEYNKLFDNLNLLGDKEISMIRGYVSRNKTTDSVFTQNIPVMHLAIGTAFFDPDVHAGNSYQYKVRKMKDKDTQIWEKASNVVQYPAKVDILKPLFKDKQELSSQILIRWFVPKQNNLNSFAVYRRVFGKGDYLKINAVKGYNTSQDTIYLISIDTIVQNPSLYEYYIEPLDIYGNQGPKSETVGAGTIGSSYNPVPEYFKARGKDKDHQIELAWSFKDKKYLRGIDVYRSASFDKGFTRIASLPANDSIFTDVLPTANQNYWYYLQINGPVNKSLSTAKVSAMFRNAGEKPLPPAEIGAESIRGGVKIFWNYNEPYAKGFYVYRYVYEKAEYMQISGLLPAGSEIYSYIDSFKYLQGNDIYRYAVRAVNDVDQMSDFSQSASASPDIKATLSSPMNLHIIQAEKGVFLVWDDLQETEPALLGYKVYRKLVSEKKYTLLPNDTLIRTKNFYSDTTLLPGKSYLYAVAAIDFYGNESGKSISITYTQENEQIVPPEINKVVNTNDGILVGWGQITMENVISLKLYRTQQSGQSQVIATLQKDEEQYLDKSVTKGQLYIYEISLITGDNQESEKCRGVSVRR